MNEYDIKLFSERFKLVCKKCGGENVSMNYEPEINYSELSGSSASLSWACHDCNDNDLVIYPS